MIDHFYGYGLQVVLYMSVFSDLRQDMMAHSLITVMDIV